MVLIRTLVLVLLVVASVTASPVAAAVWLPGPEVSSFTNAAVHPVDVAMDADGNAVAAWVQCQTCRSGDTAGGSVWYAERPAGGTWSAPQKLADLPQYLPTYAARVEMDPAGDAVISGGVLAWRRRGGDWVVRAGVGSSSADIADDGLIVAWHYEAGYAPARLLTHRPDGTETEEPAGGGYFTTLDVGPEGDAALAWLTTNEPGPVDVMVMHRPAGAPTFSQPEPAGKTNLARYPTHQPGALALSVARGGEVAVAYIKADTCESYSQCSGRIALRTRGRASGWGDVTDFGPGTDPAVAELADGAVAVAWTLAPKIQVALREPHQAAFAAPVVLGTGVPQLAGGADGSALLLTASGAAQRAAGRTFGGVVPLPTYPGDSVEDAFSAALDGHGNAIAAWFRHPSWDTEARQFTVLTAALDGAPPVISNVVVPSTARVGDVIHVRADAHDVWTTEPVRKWDFGDGTVVDFAAHRYRKAGDFTIRFSATDSSGQTAEVRRTIHVVLPRPHARVRARWQVNKSTTTLAALTVDRLPHRARVRLSCVGARCSADRWLSAGAHLVTPVRFHAGQIVRVRVSAPYHRAQTVSFRIRHDRRPRRRG